jgi:RNA polymerase sigma-70 factor (ECF subfamily)
MANHFAAARRDAEATAVESVTDDVLVERCRRELPYATGAYEQLVVRYQPFVFRTCRQRLADLSEAEEATQDVFVRVFYALPAFEGRSSFRTWLFRIAFNVCTTRAVRRRDLRAREERYRRLTPERVETPVRGRSGIDDRVARTLATLADADCRILILHHIWGFKVDEIAEDLGVRLSAAKMRLARAGERFRAAYRALEEFDAAE